MHYLYPFFSTAACVVYRHLFDRPARVVYDNRSPWIEMSIHCATIARFLAQAVGFFALTTERIILHLADGIVLTTEGLKRHHVESGITSSRRHIIIRLGIDTGRFGPGQRESFRSYLGLENKIRNLGHIGGVTMPTMLQLVRTL